MTSVGIGQGRKTPGEMAMAVLQEIRDKLARMNVRVETKTNDYGALVAIAYREDRKIAETRVDPGEVPERKILMMVERNPGEDKQAAYEEAFIQQARSFRKQAE